MGSSASIEDQLKNDIKMLDRHSRELGRDVVRMERERNNIINKIKLYARKGNINMVNELSLQVMVFKVNISKITKLQCTIESAKQKMRTARSVNEINNALVTLTKTMKIMNRNMGDTSITKIIKEYDRELDKMEVRMEMTDEALSEEIDEDERNMIVKSVLDEIGIEVSNMIKMPTNEDSEVERILESRLKSLLV